MGRHVSSTVLSFAILGLSTISGACSAGDDGASAPPADGHAGPDAAVRGDARETGRGELDGGEGACAPSRSAWEQNVSEMVSTWCGECHGPTPNFGAPFSLTSYDELVDGPAGQRRVDAMADQLLKNAMPPPTSEQPDHVALDTMVEWATCGEQHPDHTEGVRATAEPMDAPDRAPGGAEPTSFTAGGFELGTNELNRYQCFVFDAPFDETRYIRRIEPVIDEDRVLHHAIVALDSSGSQTRDSFACNGFPPGDGLLYGWAPGQNAIEFDSGGIAVPADGQIILQIHYNNGAGVEDVSDDSGVRVYHTGSASPEIQMVALGPLTFAIPPNSRASAKSICEVQHDAEILGSFPHMHEIGSEFHADVLRKNGDRETLIDLWGWSFEAQIAYETPMELEPGDELSTECIWDNPRDSTVTVGTRTEDEMCFNFAYVTPADPGFCE